MQLFLLDLFDVFYLEYELDRNLRLYEGLNKDDILENPSDFEGCKDPRERERWERERWD